MFQEEIAGNREGEALYLYRWQVITKKSGSAHWEETPIDLITLE